MTSTEPKNYTIIGNPVDLPLNDIKNRYNAIVGLEKQCDEFLDTNKGWIPVGGVGGDGSIYYQAFTKQPSSSSPSSGGSYKSKSRKYYKKYKKNSASRRYRRS